MLEETIDNDSKESGEIKNYKDSKECKEYNSLKYRTLISTGNNIEITQSVITEEGLDTFLCDDIETNKKGVWSKLSKTEKYKRIKDYVQTKLTTTYSLDENEQNIAIKFFSVLLDRKKLSKNNELTYNRDEGYIEQISGLVFNPVTRKFLITSDVNKTVKKTKKTV
jgi:hypothetical protein